MTSIPPAEPRPPPSKRLPDPPRLPHSRTTSISSTPRTVGPSLDQRHQIYPGQDADTRPFKRRRVESDLDINEPPSISNYLAVAANAVISSQPSSLRLGSMADFQTEVTRAAPDETSDDSENDDLPDLPARPWINLPTRKSDDAKPTHRSRIQVPVPTTPDAMKEPSSAPHLVMQRPAGFFPWTGKHPEDVMNDVTVKQGFFDKAPNPTEKELNTARVPIYNAFKHKGGVENLSILFSLVLDQKNQHGLISSISTFKPPPRVTLTEVKRKSWIADLANADVPLRRLSRTIPQGIRGQILLDLCLQSAVPLSRAIWFAKCVCANEIRTLKRKGTSAAIAIGTETKWLREWTVSVEQFVEQQLGQTDLPEWRTNVEYALRLVTRLYLENLLDRDHYLDWIVRSFDLAEVKHLPFWLMMVHVCKQDIGSYRRRARRLAEAMITQYEKLRRANNSAASSVQHKVYRALHQLLLDRPKDFFFPEKWPQYVNVIESCLSSESARETTLLKRLNFINLRSMGHNKQEISAPRAPGPAVVEILDAVRPPHDISTLCNSLALACPQTDLLVLTCLEWATTRFRASPARIYLVARLVKRWQQSGFAMDNLILNYLSSCREGKTTVDTASLKHLVAQLSRSETFPVAKYAQWLMVRGLPSHGSVFLPAPILPTATAMPKTPSTPTDSLQLLLDISLQNLEDHVINLRNSVLDRAGFDCEDEQNVIENSLAFLRQELGLLATFRSVNRDHDRVPEPMFLLLPWTLRSDLSTWLRNYVIEAVQSSLPSADADANLTSLRMINCGQFCFIRYVLEMMEDHAVLADVVGILISTRDEDLMASLVTTIHRHADSFSAMGALHILQARICQIYVSWRPLKSSMPLLTLALLDLCTTFPVKNLSIKLLQHDLVRGDRGRAVAACSPYSDGIAESLQQAGVTFIEDFEAILQSEPNMTEQTMSGLFSVLADRIEKQQKSPDDLDTLLAFCHLLRRLKLCRKTQGEILVRKWVARMVSTIETSFATTLLRYLIGCCCVTFSGLREILSMARTSFERCLPAQNLMKEVLSPSRPISVGPMQYKVRQKWDEFMHQEPRQALGILSEARLLSDTQSLEGLLLGLLAGATGGQQSTLPLPAKQWMLQRLDALLLSSSGSRGSQLRALFASLNKFSQAFVQLRFSLTSPVEDSDGQDSEETVKGLYEALDQVSGGKTAGSGDALTFGQLLRAVGPEIAGEVRHRVEHDFLEALPKVHNKVANPLPAVFPSDTHQLDLIMQRCFEVCTPETKPMAGFMVQLLDRLSGQIKSMAMHSASGATPGVPGLPATPTGNSNSQFLNMASSPMAAPSESTNLPSYVLDCLEYMLRMICLQRQSLLNAGEVGNTRQAQHEQCQLLVRLAYMVVQPALTSPASVFSTKSDQKRAKELCEFTMDVMASIVDEVSEEVRVLCARLLKEKLKNERLRFLFGSINSTGPGQVAEVGQGLVMVKEGKGVIGDWKPRVWEIVANGSAKENETSLGMGLFGARRG